MTVGAYERLLSRPRPTGGTRVLIDGHDGKFETATYPVLTSGNRAGSWKHN